MKLGVTKESEIERSICARDDFTSAKFATNKNEIARPTRVHVSMRLMRAEVATHHRSFERAVVPRVVMPLKLGPIVWEQVQYRIPQRLRHNPPQYRAKLSG